MDEGQWAALRQEWEAGPLVSFNELAATYGINRANIGRRAAKEGWQKNGQLTAINEGAQRRADARVDCDGNEKPHTRRSSDVPAATKQQSEDLRADVLTRHRKEWAELEQFRKAALMKVKDAHESSRQVDGEPDVLENWRVAKLAMDTIHSGLRALSVKQAGETKAWGLDFVPNLEDLTDEELQALVKG